MAPDVTKRDVLEELTLAKLKRIARALGIRIPQSVTGFLGREVLGVELRRPYIEALANSRIVTLEEIDRVLGTNYSGAGPRSRPSRAPPEVEEPEEPEVPRRHRTPATERPAEPESADSDEEESPLEYILDRYLYKEDVQDICEELELPVSGTKEDLVERVLGDEDFSPEMALAFMDKETLKLLCEELELRTSGTREDLERGVLDAIREIESPAPEEVRQARSAPMPSYPVPPAADDGKPRAPPRRELFAPQEAVGQAPLEFPEIPVPTLIPEARAPQVAQLQMVTEVLEAYRPSQRFRNEQAYEIELAQVMRQHFGPENVKTQVSIYGGRIDLEALGIGIELKVPASRVQLQTLLGQISVYRNYYGPNLAVVIFNDFAKVQDVNEFSNLLRGRGVLVLVK